MEFSPEAQINLDEDSKKVLIAADLWEHGRLQEQFDRVLGRSYDSEDMLQRSYNPVTDRWRVERLRKRGDKEGETSYKNEIRTNLMTNLSERLQVSENVIHYRIDGDKIYSEDFPEEEFSDVLLRGAEYRLHHGSTETAREGMPGERGGWEKIKAKFTDPETPTGTKMTVFSPPGMVEGSAYDRQILDEYELVQGEEGKYMKLTRRIVDFDDADYYSAALSFDPHYFDAYDGRPLDAWYLSHPVEGVLADYKIKGMSAATFDRIYDTPMLQGMIEKYIEDVTAEHVNWKQVALDINAILNQVDKEEEAATSDKDQPEQIYLSKEAVHAAVRNLGFQKPQERGGAGCPTSKGYSMSNTFSVSANMNSVAYGGGRADGTSREDCPEIRCPCGWKASESEANRVQSGSLTACPRCEWKPGEAYVNKKEREEVVAKDQVELIG